MTTKRRLADWIDGFMEYTNNSEPPFLYRMWTAIGAVAAALQRKCRLEWGPLTFYPNMYIVLVGPSGCGKGTAMEPAEDFLDIIGVKTSAQSTTREALIRSLKEATHIQTTKDGKTIAHASLTVFSKELTVFLGWNNPQLIGDLTDWYDCGNKWQHRTKTQGTDDITGVWVNLIGATTPELIQTALPMDAIGGGLTSRIIFVYEDTIQKSVPVPFLSEREAQIGEELAIDLGSINTLSGRFTIKKDVIEDRWIEWYAKHAKKKLSTDARFDGYAMRRRVHILKLCMILSASRSSEMVIEVEDFDRAVSILSKTEKNMPKTFSGVGKSPSADVTDRVMAHIATAGETTFAEIVAMFYRDADEWMLEKIVRTIERMKFCKTVYTGDKVYIKYIKGEE